MGIVSTNKTITKQIKSLEDKGFKVTKVSEEYERKTFQINKTILERFLKLSKKKGLKIKDAIDEALDLWVKRNG